MTLMQQYMTIAVVECSDQPQWEILSLLQNIQSNLRLRLDGYRLFHRLAWRRRASRAVKLFAKNLGGWQPHARMRKVHCQCGAYLTPKNGISFRPGLRRNIREIPERRAPHYSGIVDDKERCMQENTHRATLLAKAFVQARTFLNISSRAGYPLPERAKILDFCCGEGAMVKALHTKKYQASGYDIRNYLDASVKPLAQLFSFYDSERSSEDYTVDWENFRLPYPSDHFDAIFTNQVFEHLQAHEPVLKEFSRVLKKDGVSVNIYPSSAYPMEIHIKVPFGYRLHSRLYYWIMAGLGYKNEYQHDYKLKEIVEANYRYVRDSLNYLSNKEMLRLAKQYFSYAVIDPKALYNIPDHVSFIYRFFKKNTCLVLSNKAIEF